MTLWDAINAGLFQWTGMSLLHATALALLAWLLSATVLRNRHPALLAGLWTVVLVKFLIPPLLPGELSLSGLLAQLAQPLGGAAAAAGSEGVLFQPDMGTVLPAWTLGASLALLLQTASGFLKAAFLPLYLLLAGWLGVRRLVRSLLLWRRVRQLPAAGELLQQQIGELSSRIGLRRPPEALLTDGPSSPFVIGLRRPRLVLPSDTLQRLDPQAVRALIVHELAHLRRRDHWVRSIQNAARLLFFFWPPVWWVCRRVDRFAEMACDQWAVAVSRISPQLYAEALLEVARSLGAASASQQKLAFAQQGRSMEERFEMILNRKNLTSPSLSWISLLLLAAWATFAWAGGAPQQPAEQGKHVSVHQVGTEEHPAKVRIHLNHTLSAEKILQDHPEADLDGDGDLSLEELKSFHMEQRRRKMELFLERHPEADLDGDGDLSKEEMAELHEAQRAQDRAMLLEKHPEADLDGDGALSDAELLEIKSEGNVFFFSPGSDVHAVGEIAVEGGSWTIEHSAEFGEAEHNEKFEKGLEWTFEVELDPETAGKEQSSQIHVRRLKFAPEGEMKLEVRTDPSNPEGQILIKLDSGEVVEFKDGDLHWVEESEAGEASADRLQRLLKTNPEADLDGDGQISSEEARSFAAKLQADAKTKKKQ